MYFEVCKHEGKRGRLIACPIYHETSYPVRTSEHEPPFGQPTTGRAIERKSFHIIGYRIIVYVFQYVGFIHGKGKHRIIGRYPYLPPTVFHNVGDSLILYGGERSDSYKHILPAVVVRKTIPHRAGPNLLMGIDQQAKDILHITLLPYGVALVSLVLQVDADNSFIVGSNPYIPFRIFLNIEDT